MQAQNRKPLIPVDPLALGENAIRLFSQDWALLTAGTPEHHNTMTVSWGMMGELWGKHVATVFIRPQRYTFGFAEESEYFSLAFYDESYKSIHGVFGKKSGRDTDKYGETGIACLSDGDWAYTEGAHLVLLCKKLASQDLQPAGFLDPSIETNYPNRDYHRVYIGEIVRALTVAE